METYLPIVLILGALLGGAVSPGPSFVMVASTTLGASKKDGIAASLGMGIGGVLLAILALAGLHAALERVPLMYLVLKVFGGLYLVFLAYRLWRDAKQQFQVDIDTRTLKSSPLKSFYLAFITQISNPKAAIIYGGIFAALLPQTIPVSFYYLLPPLVFLVEFGWYLLVTLVLSTKASRVIYLKSKSFYDRLAGAIMACLGLKLLFSARQ